MQFRRGDQYRGDRSSTVRSSAQTRARSTCSVGVCGA